MQLRRKTLVFIFRSFNLIPTLTVRENIGFPLALVGTGRRDMLSRVDEVLSRIGLAQRSHHYPNELSGGEMQRVAIGGAVVHRPQSFWPMNPPATSTREPASPFFS